MNGRRRLYSGVLWMATSCITHPCSDEWQEEVVKWSFMNGDVVQQFPKGHVSLILGSIGSKHLVQKIKAFRYPKIFFLHCSKNKLNLPRKNRACWSRCNDIQYVRILCQISVSWFCTYTRPTASTPACHRLGFYAENMTILPQWL